MAVWLSYSARSTADRLLAISLPVSAFVACGFEHSIANLYFLPAAWLIRTMAPSSFWALIEKSPEDYAELGFTSLLHNLLPVTFGNIIGGVVLVAAIYWGIYLRKDRVG
jgi:formate transporter